VASVDGLRGNGKAAWIIQFDFGDRTEHLTLPGDLLAAKARAAALDAKAKVRLGTNPISTDDRGCSSPRIRDPALAAYRRAVIGEGEVQSHCIRTG
jgi:hypothetical protein